MGKSEARVKKKEGRTDHCTEGSEVVLVQEEMKKREASALQSSQRIKKETGFRM